MSASTASKQTACPRQWESEMATQSHGQYLAHVNPKFFAAVQLFAAVRDVRYYLQGVFIDQHHEQGVVLVATNGHHMAVMHDPEGWCERPVIVGGIPKSLIACCKKAGLEPPKHLWIGQDSAVVSSLEASEPPDSPFCADALHACRISLIDAKYPDWRKVMPRQAKPVDVMPAMNAEYVATVTAAAKLLHPSYPATRVFSTGTDCSLVFRICGHEVADKFVAIIMPVRDFETPEMLPKAFQLPAANLPGSEEARA